MLPAITLFNKLRWLIIYNCKDLTDAFIIVNGICIVKDTLTDWF